MLEEDVLDFSELECRMADFIDRSSIEDNIKIQLAEFEMLQSIFPNAKEIVLDDPAVIGELQEYADGKMQMAPPPLDFQINLTIDEKKFQISVTLPFDYPTQEPDIFARNDSLGRSEQRTLNEDLSRYITSLPRDEMCIYSGITWVQENALKYIETKPEVSPSKTPRSQVEKWARLWIYSHHIYSKTKRKALQDFANDFNITGFCLPGRPGIICFEGSQEDCEECWQKVRSMNWKKIVSVKEEMGLADNLESFRKFSGFQELVFEGKKLNGRDYHVDFGEFYRYLCEHDSEFAFKVLFGVDGRTST